MKTSFDSIARTAFICLILSGIMIVGVFAFQYFFHEEEKLTRLYSTNLTYATDEVIGSDWFRRVDLAPFTASVINTLNTNKSIAPLVNRTDRLREMIKDMRK